MMLTQEVIADALKSVKYPGYSRDIISFGLVKQIAASNGAVSLTLQLTAANPQVAQQLKEECERVLKALPEVQRVHVEVKMPAGPAAAAAGAQSPWAQQNKMPGINRVVAVASGKGGVGKSTCSVNLACALKQTGAAVGLLDCDIYGPSVPLMMGIRERPTLSEQQKMIPPSNYGVKLMSMGFLLDGDAPVIWRGPMIMKTIQQFFHACSWTCLREPATPSSRSARRFPWTGESLSPLLKRPRSESSAKASPCLKRSTCRFWASSRT